MQYYYILVEKDIVDYLVLAPTQYDESVHLSLKLFFLIFVILCIFLFFINMNKYTQSILYLLKMYSEYLPENRDDKYKSCTYLGNSNLHRNVAAATAT